MLRLRRQPVRRERLRQPRQLLGQVHQQQPEEIVDSESTSSGNGSVTSSDSSNSPIPAQPRQRLTPLRSARRNGRLSTPRNLTFGSPAGGGGISSPDAQLLADIVKNSKHNTVNLKLMSHPVTLKGIEQFEDQYKRSEGGGHALTKEQVIALIPEDAVFEIECRMQVHRPDFDSESWKDVTVPEMFELWRDLFTEGRDKVSLADRLRSCKPQFILKDGYKSLVPHLKDINRIRKSYNMSSDEHTATAQKAQVRVLLDNFPKDLLHQRLKQLMQAKGEIVSHEMYRKQMLNYALRLNTSAMDMDSCGYLFIASKDSIMKVPDKKESTLKRKTTDTNEPTAVADSKKAKLNNATACVGCGRQHPGDCLLAGHPDYNRTTKPWNFSDSGKAWAAKKRDVLPHYETLDGKGWEAPELPKSKGNKYPGEDNSSQDSVEPTPVNIYSLYDTCSVIDNNLETNTDTISFIISTKGQQKVRVNAFVDSGALASNYVSERLASWLNDNGSSHCRCSTKICSPVNDACVINLNNKKYSFQLIHNEAKINTSITAVVLNSKYDLIIGRQTLKELRLIEKFAEHFLPEEDKKLTNKKKRKRLYQMLGKERRACTPPANSSNFSVINWLSATLSLLAQGEISPTVKRELFLESIPDDDDEISRYSHDAPWDNDLNNNTKDSAEENTTDPVPQPRIEGSDMMKQSITRLCDEYKELFTMEVRKEPAKVAPFKLTVNDSEWEGRRNMSAPRPQSIANQQEIDRQTKKLLELGVIEYSQEAYNSQVLLTDKANGKKRFCIDFRNLNKATKSMGWPLPNIPHMLRRIGDKKPKYFGVLDFTSGYHQVPIDADSIRYTSFRTFGGCFRWKRLPFGLKTAPAYFQQQMQIILAPLLYKVCEIYIDDVIVYGQTEEEFVNNLRQVLERLKEHNIAVNPSKCVFGVTEIQYTGHTLNEHGLSFSEQKVEKILGFSKPITQKELKSFVGFATYFHEHIRNFSMLMAPLNNMLKGYSRGSSHLLKWDDTTNNAFLRIQDAIRNLPTLHFIDPTAPIFLHTDASDYGIGAYLFQVKEGVEYPIAFVSKALQKEQLRWDTPEKECYAIFYSLQKLSYLLRDTHFTLRTDHKNLTFLNQEHRGKVQRWKLALQEFDFDIEFIPGKINIVADGFSRLVPLDPSDVPIVEECNILLHEYQVPQHRYEQLSKVHNSIVGHHGINRTCHKLDQLNLHWPLRKQHVKTFIQECPCCQKMSQLKIPIHTHPFTTGTFNIMERVSVDATGPFPMDDYGNQYIISMIDNFSRFIEIYAVKDLEAKTFASVLLQWVGRYGAPAQLLSDNGKNFVNKIISEFNTLVGTEQIFSIRYSKQENAIVERSIKEIQRHLRAILFHKNIHYEWSLYLPLVQRIFNADEKDALGVSPAQLLFGNAIQLDKGILLPYTEDEPKEQRLSEWSAQMISRQSKALIIAKETQSKQDEEHMKSRDGDITEFPDNSYVLVEYFTGPPSKLHPILKGPLRVVNHNGSVYSLQSLIDDKIDDYHISRIRPYRYDSELNESPVAVANRDNQLWVVDSIIEHTGEKNKRSTLQFKVRWANYGPENDKWLPYRDLLHNSKLHEYLANNKMKSLIPISDKN